MSFILKLLMLPLCLLDRHRPNQRKIRWDAHDYAYIGVCQHCTRQIRRQRKGVWLADRHRRHSGDRVADARMQSHR